ncbi:hypothetical protein ABPG72_004244 [Tetrahymena utriculariae]
MDFDQEAQLEDESNILSGGLNRQKIFQHLHDEFSKSPSQQDLSSFFQKKKYEEDELFESSNQIEQVKSLSLNQLHGSQKIKKKSIVQNEDQSQKTKNEDSLQFSFNNQQINPYQNIQNLNVNSKLSEVLVKIDENDKESMGSQKQSLHYFQSQNKMQTMNRQSSVTEKERQKNLNVNTSFNENALTTQRKSLKDSIKQRRIQTKQGGYRETYFGKKFNTISDDNQWKIFAKMRKVKQFCKILLEQRFYSNYKNLNQLHLSAINDKSYITEIKSKVYIEKFEKIPVIEPNSLIEQIWDVIMFITLVQQYIVTTVEICFGISLIQDNNLFILNYLVPSIVFSIDLVIYFNIGFYVKGNIITNRKLIFNKYIRNRFIINSITTVCMVVQVYQQLFKFGILIRVIQIPNLLEKIDDHYQLSQRFNTFFELFKLMFLIFGCAHFVGCGFHFVGMSVQGYEKTWINVQQIEDSVISIKYLWSIYFAMITMVTVGYGDITPISWYERIYVIIVIIFSCGLFGYSMNTIGSIFQEIARQEAQFKQVKYEIGQYMRNRDIPKHLQTKVFKNLEYSHILEGGLVQRSEIILDNLTLTLRNQIKIEFYGRILQNYKLFNLNFSQDVRQELCLHMKEIILQPGEILYDIGQSNDKIFFLHRGSVEIVSFNINKQNSSTIGVAQSGSMLGQLGFFTGQLEILQAKSIDTCFLIYCDRNSFQQIISKNSLDMEIFYKLRDNLLIYNRQFETTCYCCQKVGHETSQCQIYSAKILKQTSIWKHLKWFQQERDSNHQRKKKKSINSLKCRLDYMAQARRLRLLYFYYAYDYDFQIEKEDLELEQNDMEFLLFIPKICYQNGEYEYSEGEISNFSDRYYDELKKEYDQFAPIIIKQQKDVFKRQETQKPEDNSDPKLSEPQIYNIDATNSQKAISIKRQSLNLNQISKRDFFKQQKNKTQPLCTDKDQMQINFVNSFNNLQNKLYQKSNSKGNQNNCSQALKNKKTNSLSRIDEYQIPSGEIQYNSETMFSSPKLNTPRINLTIRNVADIIERQPSSLYQEESKASINKTLDVLKICKSSNDDFQNVNSNQRLSIENKMIHQNKANQRRSNENSRSSLSRGQRPSILFGLNQISGLQKQLRLSNDKNIPIQEDVYKEDKSQNSSQSLSSKSSSVSSYSQSPNQVRVKTILNLEKVNEAMQILQERRSNQISQFYFQYYDGFQTVPDFDRVKEYSAYYPYNNFTKVMKLLRDKQLRFFRKQKLSRTIIRDNKKKFTEF